MLIGCGQITWRGVPEPAVLDDIARAGYYGSPPRLGIKRSAHETLELYHRHGLEPGPCYFGAPFWRKDIHQQIIAEAREAAAFTRQLGCTEMYVAPGGEYVGRSGRTRRDVAGHVAPDDALPEDEFRLFAETLNTVGQASLDEGVRSCFHNHVGTVIETGDEVERLLEATDPELVFLGPDTGHLAWAGVDVVDFCRRHTQRIKTMHLKDITATARWRGCESGWDYQTFADSGIFVELGDGCVDFPGILQILHGVGFDGWLIVETDVTRKLSALDSARASRDYLRQLGL
ncbi:MAG: sugar phosphate isomerase/epimerase [Chloroflexota bacterium]|nr:sugar phosphate isomerase/epimerase [Chloroflexota bacterium]